MKILISFLPSVFPIHNHGGSTKILKEIALYLAERGDTITIVCNQRSDNKKVFKLHRNITVMPIFRFRETYPNPYNTTPYNLAANEDILYRLSLKHDILFIFDTDFIFTDMFKHLPLLYSLRDYIYPEALQGAFLIRRGDVIVNSQFVKDSFLATAGRFYPALKSRVHLIPNGIDTDRFSKKPYSKLKKVIKISQNDGPILLYPHRPGVEKGIYEALALTEKLVKNYGLKHSKLLVPRGVDEIINPQVGVFYDNVIAEAKKKKILTNILFHPWISPELMPEYYSLGTVTLCLGNIVEAFSNAALESLACGTPVVAAKVASYRTILPDEYIYKIAQGDTEAAAKTIVSLLKNKNRQDMKKAGEFIKKKFNIETMCRRYRELLHGQKIKPAAEFNLSATDIRETDTFRLPPWSCLTSKGIYNDYTKIYDKNKTLLSLFKTLRKDFFNLKEAKSHGLDKIKINQLLDQSLIIKEGYIK